jgi:hypothetical protein
MPVFLLRRNRKSRAAAQMEGWVMAIYHFAVHVISRRAGRSAVKAAAWRAGAPLSGTLPNKRTLELGDAAEHGQGHLAGGRSRVCP